MIIQKIFSFYIYYLIFSVCSIYAQDITELSNVSFIRQNLIKKAETYLALPFVNEYEVFIFSMTPGSGNSRLQFWQEIFIERALSHGKKVYKEPETTADSLRTKVLRMNSSLYLWELKVSKNKKHGFRQQFCCSLSIQIVNHKGRVLLNSTADDCFERFFKNRDALDAVQSDEPGFRHNLPRNKYGVSDLFQTAVIAAATLSTVLMLYSFRSQ